MTELPHRDRAGSEGQNSSGTDQKRSEQPQRGPLTLVRFGPFVIDMPRRKLWRDQLPVSLSGKAFDLLVVLVEERERVVSRQELLDRVWPDVIVEEGNLTQTISVVRKALGEGAGANEYIATVPGRGYRFVAPVTAVEPDMSLQRGAWTAPRWRRLGLLALIVIVAVAAWVGGRISARRPGSVTSKAEATPRTVAVLPFYGARLETPASLEGMDVTELVITRLAGREDVRVMPAQDVLEFRNPLADTPAEAGRQLGVDQVVSGSFSRRGATLRMTVQVIRCSDSTTLLSRVIEEPYEPETTLAARLAERVVRETGIGSSGR